MKPPASFLVLLFSLLAIFVLAIIGHIPSWSYFIPAGLGITTLLMMWRGVILPARTVSYGMDLIKAQDYNNRLVKVGEPTADKVVFLFNSLIDKLRAERLTNKEQESLLKLLIDASPMGIVMLDFNEKISLYNSSFLKIIGYQGDSSLQGKAISDLKWDLLPDILSVPLGKSEVIRKGNFRVYRCYHLNFIQDGFRREFYLIESLTEEIMKAEKAAYEKVVRTISHEVNNSIGGVRSVLEVVNDVTEDPEVKRVIESCDNRCEKMCGFIRDYADVVKLAPPVITLIDLSKELNIMSPFIRRMVPSEISLDWEISEMNLPVKADGSQLQQVILNIVKNAVESIQGKGMIKVMAGKTDSGNVLLEISNDGDEISSEIAKSLFTPFFTTKSAGKGIGLTFVREVLTRHDADYRLTTDTDGITRFKILFPKVK